MTVSKYTLWRPMSSAPKDGSPVWLCDEQGNAGGPFPMRWNPRGTNAFFQPNSVGIWELEGGGLTWTDEDPDGAPTHWAPRTSDKYPVPPWETVQ